MKKEIKFNSLYSSNNYTKNLEKLFADYDLFRKKYFSNQCIKLLQNSYPDSELLLTHSATGALEMVALALDIKEGDEIILPSFTFVSTANAFALRGAKLIFVDIETETYGIDPKLVEKAITPKTKAIIGVHYAGNACKIEELKEIATKNKVYLIEDAAMAFGSKHQGKALGRFGDFSVVSFDITKHLSSTHGGLLIVNNSNFTSTTHKIYNVGTNRMAFEKGDVPYYEWVALGSKFQMSETNAAILNVQLEEQDQLLDQLQKLSALYYKALNPLSRESDFLLLNSDKIANNFHEFYLVFPTRSKRDNMMEFLQKNGVEALFHYIPLHNSKFAAKNFSYVGGSNTENTAERLLRLPFHTQISGEDIQYIASCIQNFLKNE